jgi:amino acid transporter
MTALGVLAIIMFVGITYLAYDFGVAPGGDETVVSKIARRVFGTNIFYYGVQTATMLILVLAANTSYADFPRLSSILARDRFVPRQFANQGERLAIGVFISFTLSQSGMVRHWLKLRREGWRWRLCVDGVGAVATGIVMLTLAITKFSRAPGSSCS